MKPVKMEGEVIEHTPRGAGGVGGKILMAQDVVETIAGMAAREVDGIHALGHSSLITFGDSPRRGISAEVGLHEAALDLELIIEHGCDLREVASSLRQKVAKAVDEMTGRKVVEVNISVVGIHIPEDEPQPLEVKRRVR